MICVRCKIETAGTANRATGIVVPICEACRHPRRKPAQSKKVPCACGRLKGAKAEECRACRMAAFAMPWEESLALTERLTEWHELRKGDLRPITYDGFVARMDALVAEWARIKALLCYVMPVQETKVKP